MDGKGAICVGSLACDNSFLENVACERINSSDGKKQNEKQSEFESRSDVFNESCINDDSVSDIGVLRGDNDEEERLLEKEILEKKLILSLKRTELCSRLLAYKLMQFSTAADIFSMYSVPARKTSPDTEFKVLSPIDRHADSESPASPEPTSSEAFMPEQIAADFNEHQVSFGLSEQSMIEMAIRASMEDYVKTQAAANLSPPPEVSSSTSGFPEKAQTDPRLQKPSSSISGSSQSSQPFTAVGPSHAWNKSQPDTEAPTQHREAGDNVEDINPEQEDFMEGERYVGDKGKRPLSGKYSYKKRSKTAQADSNELPSGSSLPKEDRSAE